MANPQCEDGFTKIANELLDAMCQVHLNGQQWKVMHAIIRKTYGWNQKTDWITASQITLMTNMNRSDVCQALRVLLSRRVILRDGRRIGVQKDYTAWVDVAQTGKHCGPNRQQGIAQIGNTVAQTGTVSLPKQAHTKYTKTLIQKTFDPKTKDLHKALLKLCRYDVNTIPSKTIKALTELANGLHGAGHTAQDIDDFSSWWSRHDWRGRKGQGPTVTQVADLWGSFLADGQKTRQVTVDGERMVPALGGG